MSEPTTEQPVEAQTPPPPTPLAELNDLAEYRKRIAAGEDPTAEPKAPEPAAEPAAEQSEAQPDPASEAGKALAAKKKSLQARIDDITAERETARREADATRAELAALRAELAQSRVKPTEQPEPQPIVVPPDPNDPEPIDTQFDDYGKFVAARARWEARQELRQYHAQLQQQAMVYGQQQAQARVEGAALAVHPDFNEVMGKFVEGGGSFSPVVADVILNHPQGHEVAYALAKDPALNAKIAAIQHPGAAMLEIGQVLAQLGQAAKPAAEPKAKPVSKAPAPVEPVAAASSPATFDPATSNSVGEWRKHRSEFAR